MLSRILSNDVAWDWIFRAVSILALVIGLLALSQNGQQKRDAEVCSKADRAVVVAIDGSVKNILKEPRATKARLQTLDAMVAQYLSSDFCNR